MKNLVLLFGLLLMLIISSCDESIVPSPEEDNNNEETENKIKPEDLVGNWDFISLLFNGITTYSCGNYLTDDYNLVTLDLHNVTESEMTLHDKCENGDNTFEYTIEEDLIINYDSFGDEYVEFQIMNYDSFEGDTLKLKLIEPSDYDILPIGGIYTVAKQ